MNDTIYFGTNVHKFCVNLMICESDHFDSLILKHTSSSSIVSECVCFKMLAAIQFDHQLCGCTIEVCNIA